MTGRTRGSRFQVAGSADATTDIDALIYTHSLIKRLVEGILVSGGGLVVTIGSEPCHDQSPNTSTIFDWSVLEALEEAQAHGLGDWPEFQGARVVAVGLPNWIDRIPSARRDFLSKILESGTVRLVQVQEGLGFGGMLRETQAFFGDILLAFGGGPGVEHLAQLYRAEGKTVIPFDVPLKTGKVSAAERLSSRAMEKPDRFFSYLPKDGAAAALSRISLKDSHLDQEAIRHSFEEFLEHLARPRAFYVRLLDRASRRYHLVENFFRVTVDPVLAEIGYDRFEESSDATQQPFLNVEIFEMLHYSSLVVADLTDLRPNCLAELGYALGRGKRTIVTAHQGTKLPFDVAALPCFFWLKKTTDYDRKNQFAHFLRMNIDRRPVVGFAGL